MSNRYSRSEKEKWVATPNRQTRRAPIPIPAPSNDSLIESNKFTLIGRVTNPAIQKPRAVVDFFLQHWSVVGNFTGRDLGSHLFHFRFESERDLQSILNKGPFHFKRWMLILQRWEPSVADDFPSDITFWVKIHGIPLHYWTEQALHVIGSDIGLVESKDVDQGRVRVRLNGLKPLEMFLDISLPSGKTKEVELQYEKLDKHCFLCKSLSHEADDCPDKRNANITRSSSRDINQTNTLENLDSYKRARDDRKLERGKLPLTMRREHEHQSYQAHRRPDYYSRRGEDRRKSPPHSEYTRNSRQQRVPNASFEDMERSRVQSRENRNSETRNRGNIQLETTPSNRISASQRISHGHTNVHSR